MDDIKAIVSKIVDEAAEALHSFDPSIAVGYDARQALVGKTNFDELTLDAEEQTRTFAAAISVFAELAKANDQKALWDDNESEGSLFRTVDAESIQYFTLPWPFHNTSAKFKDARAIPTNSPIIEAPPDTPISGKVVATPQDQSRKETHG